MTALLILTLLSQWGWWGPGINADFLQGKDTTALWNAKTLQGKDTTALWIHAGTDSAGRQRGNSGIFGRCSTTTNTTGVIELLAASNSSANGTAAFSFKNDQAKGFYGEATGSNYASALALNSMAFFYADAGLRLGFCSNPTFTSGAADSIEFRLGGYAQAARRIWFCPAGYGPAIRALGPIVVDSAATLASIVVGDTVMLRTTGGAAFAATKRFTTYADSCAGVDTVNLAALNASGARARVITLRDSVFVKNGATVITTLTATGKWCDLEYLGAPCSRWAIFGSN